MPGNESTAKLLGYAGLIPFVVFSAGSWVPLAYVSDATAMLISYAAVILAFMGAIHWGVAMVNNADPSARHFIVSVIPALLGWLALQLPQLLALVVLLCGFIGLFIYDRAVAKVRLFPGWYIPMRIRLTFIVALCLTASLVSVSLK